MTTRICSKCGEEKKFLHGDYCQQKRTAIYIKQVFIGLSKKAPEFSNLARTGMDEVILSWCQKSLDMAERVTDADDHEFILQNNADVIDASNSVLDYPPNDTKCSICGKDPSKCSEDRVVTWENVKNAINERIDFGGQNKELDVISEMTHFGLSITTALIKVFETAVDEQNNGRIEISAQLLANFLTENINMVRVFQLLGSADAAIGW